jgi:hypothetical protein
MSGFARRVSVAGSLLVIGAMLGCAWHICRIPLRTISCDRKEIPKDLLTPGSVVLFGEIHGTQELPASFGEAVCATSAAGLPVEVGLEQPREGQAGVDSFLASAGGEATLAPVLAAPFWHREYQDGRSSRAQLDLLERLRGLRARGSQVNVFLFDLDPAEDVKLRDQKMAEQIVARARAHPDAVVLVLVGEVHSWMTPGAPWDPEFRPMGWHIEQAGLRVRSLGRATPRGTVWVCTGPNVSDCGERETAATEPLPSGRPTGIELLPSPNRRGVLGLFAARTLTASPPAI